MPRFADSKEIVANEDVEPIDEQYRKYLEEVEHRLPFTTLSPLAEHRIDIAERQERNL